MSTESGIPRFIAEMAEQTRASIGGADREVALERALSGVLEAAVTSGICDLGGVTERAGRQKLHTVASTGELVDRLDSLQYEWEEGPCVQASYSDGALFSQDVRQDARWPNWGPAAADLGVGAVLSVHLYTAHDEMGALNLYSLRPRAFGSRDLDLARFMASTASFALGHYRTTKNLWTAIDARHRIGAAQGVLIGKFDITQEQAFEVLRRLSRRHEQSIADIAIAIVQARGLPPELRS